VVNSDDGGQRTNDSGERCETQAGCAEADHPAGTALTSGDLDPSDIAAVAAQLGRPPRAMHAIAHRCPCGRPDVVETSPRLADGTPFPTLYYLTCPRACSAVGRLEAAGVMREMGERLRSDADLAQRYVDAARSYVARRDELGVLEGAPTAGGMPNRVKCLHVHVAHALASGRGVNPFGDEAIDAIGSWWEDGPCV
jgi:hypothetical protein